MIEIKFIYLFIYLASLLKFYYSTGIEVFFLNIYNIHDMDTGQDYVQPKPVTTKINTIENEI